MYFACFHGIGMGEEGREMQKKKAPYLVGSRVPAVFMDHFYNGELKVRVHGRHLSKYRLKVRHSLGRHGIKKHYERIPFRICIRFLQGCQ
jgi:hypothetical protein